MFRVPRSGFQVPRSGSPAGRRISACAAALIAAVGLAGWTPAAQIQFIRPPQLPRGTASITGVVIGDGKPVPGATVVLSAHEHSSYQPQGPYSGVETVADGGGRFAFAGLPSLPLILSASAPSFATGVYGQARPGLAGTPIRLADAQRFEATIHLVRGGRISGSVLDSKGVPAAGIEVYAFRLEPIGDTATVMGPGGNAVTNTQGGYVISDLPGGRFLVRAWRTWGDGERPPALKGPEGEAVIESSAFYPRGTRVNEHEAVELRPAESRTGIDIRLRLEPISTVTCVVRNADGSPARGAHVQLLPADDQPVVISKAVTDDDGSFQLERARPGAYRLVAYSATAEPHWGETVIESDGRKAIQAVIDLRPGGTITGRIAYSGRSPVQAPSKYPLFLARIRDSMMEEVHPVPRTSATPEFAYRGVPPGRYLINVHGAPPGWFVQSEMVDGVDALDFPFAVAGSETKQVLITLSDAWTEIAGRVTGQNGGASTEGTVVVFPIDESYWGVFSRRIETIRPDTNGQYRFRGLPAGEYAIALGSSEIDGRPHSSLMRTLRSSGRRFTLRPGDSLKIDLRGRLSSDR